MAKPPLNANMFKMQKVTKILFPDYIPHIVALTAHIDPGVKQAVDQVGFDKLFVAPMA